MKEKRGRVESMERGEENRKEGAKGKEDGGNTKKSQKTEEERLLKDHSRTKTKKGFRNESKTIAEVQCKEKKSNTHSSLISQTSQCGCGNATASTQSAAPRCTHPH